MYISKDDDYVPTFESRWIHRGWTTGLSLLGRESIPGVPTASQEEALSTGKARGTQGRATIPRAPRCLSPFQRNLFSLHCLDFHAEDRLAPWWHVGQRCGKASWESLEGKPREKYLEGKT